MKLLNLILLILIFFTLGACQNEEEKALKDKVSSIASDMIKVPSSVSAITLRDYKAAELAINRQYVSDIKDIVYTDFDERVDEFEDKEFGFFRSYKHMFKVLLNDSQEMADYWNLKKSKYFSNIGIQQKLHNAYLSYNSDIQHLRMQISNSPYCDKIPKEVLFNIPDQSISLEKMTEHSYKNLAIEFGPDIAIWLLGLLFVGIFSFQLGFTKSQKAWITTLLTIIVSVILTIWNDNSMMNSIKDQHSKDIDLDYSNILNQLDQSTSKFYDYISK